VTTLLEPLGTINFPTPNFAARVLEPLGVAPAIIFARKRERTEGPIPVNRPRANCFNPRVNDNCSASTNLLDHIDERRCFAGGDKSLGILRDDARSGLRSGVDGGVFKSYDNKVCDRNFRILLAECEIFISERLDNFTVRLAASWMKKVMISYAKIASHLSCQCVSKTISSDMLPTLM